MLKKAHNSENQKKTWQDSFYTQTVFTSSVHSSLEFMHFFIFAKLKKMTVSWSKLRTKPGLKLTPIFLHVHFFQTTETKNFF